MSIRASAHPAALVAAVLVALLASCRAGQEPTSVSRDLRARETAITRSALLDTTAGRQILVGAGDVGSCSANRDEYTARLLDVIPGTVIMVGDGAYSRGTSAEYADCYQPTWGRHLARTRPVPGERDTLTPGTAGYFGYFGPSSRGVDGNGYYSYDLGTWHVVALNSEIPIGKSSAQYKWLKQDLKTSSRRCTVAYFHHPRFYSTASTVAPRSNLQSVWELLYARGVEVVVNAHSRVYERFAPQTPLGALDTTYGVREIIAGTGGAALAPFDAIAPNSLVRISGTAGVLALVLDNDQYAWEFVPVAGKTATDAGVGRCHDAPPPIAKPGGPYGADATITFDGSASVDLQNDYPLTYTWDFGDGTTGTGAAPSHRYAANGNYPVSLVVTDSKGNRSLPATTTAAVAVLLGAGDIANCSYPGAELTARLIDTLPGAVFTAGDDAYPDGTTTDFAQCYAPTWGRHRARTRPTPGNHDYHVAGAVPYFSYFGAAAGDPAKGYYSYDVGSWHVVALNSQISMSDTSSQMLWLGRDLAASTRKCTLAYLHYPRFSSGDHGNSTATATAWKLLYTHGAEVVVAGHDHDYERFAPLTPTGALDTLTGIREFVVGTGGGDLRTITNAQFGSELRIGMVWGVIKFVLGDSRYSWSFITSDGKVADSGSARCH